jgi:hypothetical protein
MIIDNSGPVVTFHFDGSKLSGYAEDFMTEISSLMYQIDGGNWISFTSTDAMLDSKREEFGLDVPIENLSKGAHRIVIKAVDEHGNSTLIGKSFVTK